MQHSESAVIQLLQNRFLRLAARLGIGGLMVVSGVGKILNPYGFMASVEAYGLVSGSAALLVAIIFPWLEAVFGATLLLGIFPRVGALVTTGLLAVFTGVMVLSWGKTLPGGCGCFPWEQETVTVGLSMVARDTGILLVSLYAWAYPSRWLALHAQPRDREPSRGDSPR